MHDLYLNELIQLCLNIFLRFFDNMKIVMRFWMFRVTADMSIRIKVAFEIRVCVSEVLYITLAFWATYMHLDALVTPIG